MQHSPPLTTLSPRSSFRAVPDCLVYTGDPDLRVRLEDLLRSRARVHGVTSPVALERSLEQMSPVVLLLDLRNDATLELLREVRRKWVDPVVIALAPDSLEPALRDRSLDLFGFESPDGGDARLESLLHRAFEHVHLRMENEQWRAQTLRPTAPGSSYARPAASSSAWLPLRDISRAFRHFENIETLLQNIVETIASQLVLGRVGVFARSRDNAAYRLRAGWKCLEETKTLEYAETDPLVEWMKLHAQLISRLTLDHEADASLRMDLGQALHRFGAEVILPLHGANGILGWLFLGKRITGVPFDALDLQEFTSIAEHVSSTLEKAFLYEELAVQKTLLETLFHAMPTGIVAVGVGGSIQYVNRAAGQMLALPSETLLNRPLSELRGRLGSAVQRALRETDHLGKFEWADPVTRHAYLIQIRKLFHMNESAGTLALIEDVTTSRVLEEKQKQLERAISAADLVDKMSHELRNPLVAIKTFTQLLPERHADPEFYREFGELVVKEVDRLNRLTDHINSIFYRNEVALNHLDVLSLVQRAWKLVLEDPAAQRVRMETLTEDKLPTIFGDEDALVECLTHVLQSMVSSVAGQQDAFVSLTARPHGGIGESPGVTIRIRSNLRASAGSSDPEESLSLRRALDLRTVRQTILNHNGRLNLESSEDESAITILLPSTPQEALS
ncbi:MAG: PAS domain-containing protein [Verrucomicrobiae bacterium]|nr:PAS domain-containing protein [Verrucomicrobiae bacterium]